MSGHPLYTMALASRSDLDQRIAHAMQAQLGGEWWYQYAHPQTIRDYVCAKDDNHRLSAMQTMIRDGVSAATQAYNALLSIG